MKEVIGYVLDKIGAKIAQGAFPYDFMIINRK